MHKEIISRISLNKKTSIHSEREILQRYKSKVDLIKFIQLDSRRNLQPSLHLSQKQLENKNNVKDYYLKLPETTKNQQKKFSIKRYSSGSFFVEQNLIQEQQIEKTVFDYYTNKLKNKPEKKKKILIEPPKIFHYSHKDLPIIDRQFFVQKEQEIILTVNCQRENFPVEIRFYPETLKPKLLIYLNQSSESSIFTQNHLFWRISQNGFDVSEVTFLFSLPFQSKIRITLFFRKFGKLKRPQ